MEVLTEFFVIGEEEGFVLLDRRADGTTKLIAFEAGNGGSVEEVARVKGIVAEEFVDGAVELVGSGLSDDEHLCARTFAVFGAVRIGK